MRVWTVQNRRVWDHLKAGKTLQGDGRRPPPEWKAAYAWMIEQMVRRGLMGRPRFPVWGWYQPKPDLRQGGHLAPGTRGVRLELEVPLERALLSHFEGWHCVLNGWYVPISWKEDRTFDRLRRRLDKAGRLKPGNPPASLKVLIRKSWTRIFDWKRLDKSPLWRTQNGMPHVQAVLAEVEPGDVIRAEPFISRCGVK